MGFIVIVPARMSSSRLKNKPLADIAGKPMVVRTAERALQCGAEAVYVACDDPAIAQACADNNIQAILTNPNCPTGTDRLAEAVEKLGLSDETVVVNVQGDEPLIPVDVIRAVAEDLCRRGDCAIATAAHPITEVEISSTPTSSRSKSMIPAARLPFHVHRCPGRATPSVKTSQSCPRSCRPITISDYTHTAPVF